MSANSKKLRSGVCAAAILTFAAILAVVISVLVWYSGLERRRDAWLNTLPVDRLQSLANRADADQLVRVVAAEKMSFSGKGEQAWDLANKARSLVAADDAGALAQRIRIRSALLDAEYGDPAQARKELAALQKQIPSDPRLTVLEGEIVAREGDLNIAYSLFIQATQKMPNSSETWRHAGRAALGASLFPEAVFAYRHAVLLSPAEASLHASLADALGKVANFSEANKEAAIGAKLAPDTPRYAILPVVGAAIGARTEEEYVSAVALLKDALDHHPEDSRMLAMLAGLHMRFNQLSQARDAQQNYLVHAPRDTGGWVDLEQICRRMGDTDTAQIAGANAAKLRSVEDDVHDLTLRMLMHPTDANAYYQLSMSLHRAGKMRRAYSALAEAARLEPKNQKYAQMLGQIQAMIQSSGNSNAAPEGSAGSARPE